MLFLLISSARSRSFTVRELKRILGSGFCSDDERVSKCFVEELFVNCEVGCKERGGVVSGVSGRSRIHE